MIRYKKELAIVALIVCLTAPALADDASDTTDSMVLVNKAHVRADANTAYIRGKAYYDQAKGSAPALAKHDYAAALKCFHIAADRGKTEALSMIAVMYSEGDGVKQDYNEAAEWYARAAQQSNAEAQSNLHTLYSHNYDQDLLPDYASAYLQYSLTASAGNQ